MTAASFQKWMDHCGFRFAADVAQAIGINRNRAQEWIASVKEDDDIAVKLTVRLAMAHVAKNGKPWPE